MTTLYRKYRPQTFFDVTDQEHIVRTLTNEIASDHLAHAYLFSGPRGVGKTTFARLMAKAVNCQKRKSGESEPCNECSSCRDITESRHIDVVEIDAASQTGVDNVRENIIESANVQPTSAKYKVFIIDEVHMLSTSAFNALLKTIEEPPSFVMFILATTDLHKLPATIVSRCQRFQFKKISYDSMLGRLEKIAKEEGVKVDKEVFERIIEKSEGGLRDAESLLGQVFSLGLKKVSTEDVALMLPTPPFGLLLSYIEYITSKDQEAAFKLINQLIEDGTPIDQFMTSLLEMLRTIMIIQASGSLTSRALYSETDENRLKKIAKNIDPNTLLRLIDRAMTRRLQVKTSPIPQLPLELLVIEFTATPTSQRETPPEPPTTLKETFAKAKPEQKPTEPPKEVTEAKAIEPATEHHGLADSFRKAVATISHLGSPSTTLEQVRGAWDSIVQKINMSNPSLTIILSMCKPTLVNHEGLHITLPYSFHKEKLEELKNRKIIEDILEQTFSEKLHFVCEVVTEQAAQEAPSDLQNLAAAFGGEVVN